MAGVERGNAHRLTPAGRGVAVLPGGGFLQPGAVLLCQRPTAPAQDTVHPAGLEAAATQHRARPPGAGTPLDVAQVRGAVAD